MLSLLQVIVILPLTVSSFVLLPAANSVGVFHQPTQKPSSCLLHSSSPGASDSNSNVDVDVSDLGLTMDDFNAPFPQELLEGLTSTGYESTNKVASIDDEGCEWTESLEACSVQLLIPGLRGQPAAAVAVLFSTTTLSVSVFGRVVWSTILRGSINPARSSYEVETGADMIPVIRLQVRKQEAALWGGFILQIGENSLL
jgi:hypothetical protein